MEFEPTRVYWTPAGSAPVELSGQVTSMRFEPVTEENFLDGWAKPITLRFKGRTSPKLYRLLFGRSHPRIRRMHSAYGRRRGRGRW